MAYLAWFLYSFGIFVLAPMFILLPQLYPTGRFLSPRWRWLTMGGLVIVAISGAVMGLLPDLRRDNGFSFFFPQANPFGLAGLPPWWYAVFSTTASLSFISLILVGVAAMIVRLKRSRGDERQQMKWLAYFLATAVVIQMLIFELPGAFFYPQLFETILYKLTVLGVFLGFPFVIGIAIFCMPLMSLSTTPWSTAG